MHTGFRRAARVSAVTRAASALELYAPGGTPSHAQRWGLSDNRVALRVFSDACPSSGLPHSGPARSTPSVERTHGLRAGRVSLL
jgi:hypothetical protein